MKKRFYLTTALAFILVSFFISCSSHSESIDFTARLDVIDSYISQAQTREAFRELKKVEKKAYSSYERLGIYKRYQILGEEKLAEQVLVKALKKLPDNPELSAVYSVFLLRHDRLQEAAKLSDCLRETPYASINSECILRMALIPSVTADQVFAGQTVKKPKKSRSKKNHSKDEIDLTDKTALFYDERFIPVYRNAWKGSSSGFWLINAAVISLSNGDKDSAKNMYDKKFSTARDGFFWATVFYDCAMYSEALECIERALTFKPEKPLLAKLLVLKADCLYFSDEKDLSQQVRDTILADSLLPHSEKLYVNNVLYYREKGDVVNEYLNLVYAVELYPYFEPALGAYGQFAISVLKRPPEDDILLRLRAAGLKTLQMERNDMIPVVAVEDALLRIQKAREKNNTPLLAVTAEKLKDALNSVNVEGMVPETQKQAESRLWLMLEHSAEEGLYPQEIQRYALGRFIELGQTEKARELYKSKVKDSAGSLWQKEYEAWFYALDEEIFLSEQLYKEIAEKANDRNLKINAFVNLAVIYEGLDRNQDALLMLNQASALALDPCVKAEILFRIADIEYGLGETKSAVRSLKYAVTLDPEHKKARLLLKKVDF